jgi:hypothetical protein
MGERLQDNEYRHRDRVVGVGDTSVVRYATRRCSTTGVELVGQVAELVSLVLPRDYRTVNTTEARIARSPDRA